MTTKTTQLIHGRKIKLWRRYPKLGEIITWDVLTEDGKQRLGVIRQMNDYYIQKRIGWQSFQVKFWIGSRLWEPKQFVGKSRTDVLNQMIRKPSDNNDC